MDSNIKGHQSKNGNAEYEFLIERAEDGSHRAYLIRIWGDADIKTKRRTTALVQDGHNYYIATNPSPRNAKEAERAAISWVEELDRIFTPLPPPQLTESVPTSLKMTIEIWKQIEQTIGSKRAETGGPLGGSRDDFIVEHFHYDHSAQRTGATYSPDHEELNRLFREEWNPAGINLLGFVHSHPPGIWRPSGGDLFYAGNILRAIPDLPYLLLPIVKTRSDTGAFEIFPYAAVRNGKDIKIIPLKLEKVSKSGRLSVDSGGFHNIRSHNDDEATLDLDTPGSNKLPKER